MAKPQHKPMTAARLKEARDLPRRIMLLKAELSEMRADNATVSDVVLDYRTGEGLPVTITGFDWSLYERRQKALRMKEAELKAVTEWVEAIDDEEARLVFRMRYLERKSWQKIANALGMPQNEDYPRKCIRDAYLKREGIKDGR